MSTPDANQDQVAVPTEQTEPAAQMLVAPTANQQPLPAAGQSVQSNSPQPQQPQSPQVQNPSIVRNPSAQPQTIDPNHPAIKRAGILHSIAETLAGGPRRAVRILPDGTREITETPLAKKDIAMAIALEAISGGLTGLAAGRGRGPGAAGAAAFAQAEQRQQQIRQQEDQQAQQDHENQSKALAVKAGIFETNSRTVLNTNEAEKLGQDMIRQLIEINRPALDQLEPTDIDGRNVTQPELLDGINRGKFSAADMLGPIDGMRQVQNPDGTIRWEATHVVIKNPNALVKVTPEQYDKYAAAGVPGFPKTDNPKAKQWPELPYRVIQNANERWAAHVIADRRLGDLHQLLRGTEWEKQIPEKINFDTPGTAVAMGRFQKYVSHPGLDIYAALQAMAASTKPSHTGEVVQNPDAKYADMAAQAMGGWNLLKAAHDKLQADSAAATSKAEAEARIPAEKAIGKIRSDQEVQTARRMIPVKADQAAAETKAKMDTLSRSAHNEDGSWNQSSLPVQLVEGNIDPSQLSKRSADYDSKLQLANEYSLQKYGKPFDIAQAQSDYRFATNIQTQNTLKYLNSLTGSDNRSGNLGALVSLSNKIGRTDFPAINDTTAWARIQTGSPIMASYYAAVTEVADQVGKIMQGGGTGSGTSDAKLKQAAELFKTGFSTDQITAVSNTLRTLLSNRKSELIGDNRYLKKQFGQTSGLQPGFVRFQSSDGRIIDIPQGNLAAARQRDPGLKVMQ